MSPRVTDAHIEARRREILTAAFRCFARDGLHGATMQEIAEEAGLSAGALYGYFDGKEALVRALAAESAERRKVAFARLEEGGAAALGELVFDLLGELEAEEASSSVRLDVRLWAEMLDRPEGHEIIVEAFGGLIGPVARFVRREAEEKKRMRDDVDPGAVGRLVVSLLVGLELQRAYEPDLELHAYRKAARALLAGLET